MDTIRGKTREMSTVQITILERRENKTEERGRSIMATHEKKPYYTITVTGQHQDPEMARRGMQIAAGLSDTMKSLSKDYEKVVGKE